MCVKGNTHYGDTQRQLHASNVSPHAAGCLWVEKLCFCLSHHRTVPGKALPHGSTVVSAHMATTD